MVPQREEILMGQTFTFAFIFLMYFVFTFFIYLKTCLNVNIDNEIDVIKLTEANSLSIN